MEQLGQRTGKILVVDDEKNYRIVLARLFEGAGYQVLVAHDAESAMEILQRERVSLIISDLCLTTLDRLYFCQQARAQFGPIPCVVFTADATRIDPIAKRQAGVVCCLEKPFDNQVILKLAAENHSTDDRLPGGAVGSSAEQPATEQNLSICLKERELL